MFIYIFYLVNYFTIYLCNTFKCLFTYFIWLIILHTYDLFNFIYFMRLLFIHTFTSINVSQTGFRGPTRSSKFVSGIPTDENA